MVGGGTISAPAGRDGTPTTTHHALARRLPVPPLLPVAVVVVVPRYAWCSTMVGGALADVGRTSFCCGVADWLAARPRAGGWGRLPASSWWAGGPKKKAETRMAGCVVRKSVKT